jgi:hypothetical protein
MSKNVRIRISRMEGWTGFRILTMKEKIKDELICKKDCSRYLNRENPLILSILIQTIGLLSEQKKSPIPIAIGRGI